MPVWEMPAVDSQPVVRLMQWTVVKVSSTDGTVSAEFIHGRDIDQGIGRCSTPILAWDADERVAVTRSGRRYQLIGPPGLNRDSEYVFNSKFAQVLEQCISEDVSANFAPATEPEPSS